MDKDVNIYFKVEGLDGYITNLDDLNDALNKVDKSTKDVSDSADAMGKAGSKSTGFFNTIKSKGVGAFKALKGAIAATGIGLLITAIASLLQWFKETDTGVKILRGSTEALGAIFNKIVELVTPLGEKLSSLFSNPKQALIDFGTAIKDNIIARFEGILNFIPSISKSIGELFKGNFKEAGKIAFDAVAQVTTGVEGASDKIADFGAAAVEVFTEVVQEVNKAVTASNKLIDAQNALRQTQQKLLVDNAKLNQELETQQKIADDTTRSYDERKAALDRVNAANETLAANAVKLAEEEKAVLLQQLQLAKTDEERREIKDQLAQAEANLIDAQTQAQLVALDAAQKNRELDIEELDRQQELADAKAELDADEIKRKKEQREEELAEIKAHHDALIAAEQQLADAKAEALKAGFGLASALAGDNEKLQNAIFLTQRAVEAAQIFIKGKSELTAAQLETKRQVGVLAGKAAANPLTSAYHLGLIPGVLSAGTATANAIRLNTGIGIAGVLAASIGKFKGGGGGDLGGGGGGGTTPSPSAAINYNFGQEAGGTIQPGQSSTGGQAQPIQTYVLASDVTNAQQAQQQINNLAKL